MSLIALLLALVALPLAILDTRIALGGLVLAAVLATSALVRGQWIWLGRTALVLVVAGGLLVGWEIWELHGPLPGPTAIQASPDDGDDREVLLPLTVEREPVSALAIIDLGPDADPVYTSFEPQVLDRGHEQGMRIIAYRHDGHVDFYDDLTLTPEPDEPGRVTGKGRLHYSHVDLSDPILQRDHEGRVHIQFAFIDVEGRHIRAHLREHTTRRSVPFNLLAPVGLSSTDPAYFPLFLLHDFEFIRTTGSDLDLTIDGRPVPLAPFPAPVPVQGQLRSFSKYTMDSELHSVFPTSGQHLERVVTDGDLHRDGGTTYHFDGAALSHIRAGSTEFVFDPPLEVTRPGEGRLTIASHPGLGRICGQYRVARDGPRAHLSLGFDEVNVPHQRGLLYRLIVHDDSAFGTWPLAYRYEATINLDTDSIDAQWTNHRPGG